MLGRLDRLRSVVPGSGQLCVRILQVEARVRERLAVELHGLYRLTHAEAVGDGAVLELDAAAVQVQLFAVVCREL